MMTFLSILFILVSMNAFLLLFSVNRNKRKIQKAATNFSNSSSETIYPLNIVESNYKKAV